MEIFGKSIGNGVITLGRHRYSILLTLDYELYGDGTGDVLRDVVKPTERILSICERFGCRITIF